MQGANTPKINQIEMTITTMTGQPIEELFNVEVLLLDDASKHIKAVNDYPNSNWVGCPYWGDITPIEQAVDQFMGPLQKMKKDTVHNPALTTKSTSQVRGQRFFSPEDDEDTKPFESRCFKIGCIIM